MADLAARQYTIVTSAQLRAIGIGRSTIVRAVARGQLHRVHQGVYSLIPESARPRLAAECAAVLACGPNAVLSHHSAAWMHDLGVSAAARASRVHVTLIASDRRRPGIHVHRTARPHPEDHHRLERLPVTSLARTLIDLAPTTMTASDLALERLLDQALRKTSATRIRDALARRPGAPGTARLGALLDPTRPSADTWSDAEARLLALLRRADLPAPEANVAIGGYIPDLLWREQRLIVEFDFVAFHSGPAAFHGDRDRHNVLTVEGYQVLHVTWRQLTQTPLQVLVWIATALARAHP